MRLGFGASTRHPRFGAFHAPKYVPIYIDIVLNRQSRPVILLREGWREGKKIRKRTLANLSDWLAQQIEALRAVLKGPSVVDPITEAFLIAPRTRPPRSTPLMVCLYIASAPFLLT